MVEKELRVKKGSNGFSRIIVGDAKAELAALIGDRKAIIITDKIVYPLFKKIINEYAHIVVNCGEQHKTIDTLCQIYSELLTLSADRTTLIVGFGGGIVTDIAGFAASTYMRGLDFGFVATTLLSQVDASIGGKNGINYEGYKNMIGTFTQPSFVLCDPSMLSSLPEREFRAGLAEVIKMGIIRDKSLFDLFYTRTLSEVIADLNLQKDFISRAISIKAELVGEDEKEEGVRKKLNLGHTIGHAIERSTDKYIHGEAVAIGMSMIAEISWKLGYLPDSERAKVDQVLTNMNLPIKTDVPMELIFNALRLDKKKETNNINLVIMRGIGDCEMLKLSFEELAKVLNLKK